MSCKFSSLCFSSKCLCTQSWLSFLLSAANVRHIPAKKNPKKTGLFVPHVVVTVTSLDFSLFVFFSRESNVSRKSAELALIIRLLSGKGFSHGLVRVGLVVWKTAAFTRLAKPPAALCHAPPRRRMASLDGLPRTLAGLEAQKSDFGCGCPAELLKGSLHETVGLVLALNYGLTRDRLPTDTTPLPGRRISVRKHPLCVGQHQWRGGSSV